MGRPPKSKHYVGNTGTTVNFIGKILTRMNLHSKQSNVLQFKILYGLFTNNRKLLAHISSSALRQKYSTSPTPSDIR